MKFNVGDKVTIREDLSRHEWNVVSDMESYRGKVATITGVKGLDDYSIDLDDGWWYWDDSMFEESKEEKETNDELDYKADDTKVEDDKFRAFLNEVARGDKSADNDEYYEMYSKLNDVSNAINSDKDLVDVYIDELVEFYSNFEPKPIPKPKKMTLDEIEEKLGYKIELVED